MAAPLYLPQLPLHQHVSPGHPWGILTHRATTSLYQGLSGSTHELGQHPLPLGAGQASPKSTSPHMFAQAAPGTTGVSLRAADAQGNEREKEHWGNIQRCRAMCPWFDKVIGESLEDCT